MTWTMHVPGPRRGAVQACQVCGYVLQDVTPPPGLIVPELELELTVREVPWWPPGGRVLVRDGVAVDLAAADGDGQQPDWRACTAAAAS